MATSEEDRFLAEMWLLAAGFDVTLANILPAKLQSEIPIRVDLLKPAAQVLISGILAEQEAKVLA